MAGTYKLIRSFVALRRYTWTEARLQHDLLRIPHVQPAPLRLQFSPDSLSDLNRNGSGAWRPTVAKARTRGRPRLPEAPGEASNWVLVWTNQHTPDNGLSNLFGPWGPFKIASNIEIHMKISIDPPPHLSKLPHHSPRIHPFSAHAPGQGHRRQPPRLRHEHAPEARLTKARESTRQRRQKGGKGPLKQRRFCRTR